MKRNIIKGFLFGLTLLTVFSACRKDDFTNDDNELGDGGKTLILFAEAASSTFPSTTTYYAKWTNMKEITLFNIRKNAVSNAALMTPTTVNIVAAPLPANTATITYVTLPDAAYTLKTNAKVTKTATGWTLNFAAGDFINDVTILIDGTKLDPTVSATAAAGGKKYALAYTLGTVSQGATTTAGTGTAFTGKNRTVIIQVAP